MHGCTELHFAVVGSTQMNGTALILFTEINGTVEDYLQIIQLLISHSSIDIDAVTHKGFTSLMCASCSEVVELLLRAGANPNTQVKTFTTLKDMISDLPGDILLQSEIKSCNLLNVSVLKGVSLYGWTALMFAIWNGHLDIVQMLLQAKANPNLQNETGFEFTALTLAVINGYFDIVQQLLECGANPNISGRDGSTPLNAAVNVLSLQYVRKFKNNVNPILLMECEIVDPSGSCEDYLKIIQLLIAQPNIDIVVNTRFGPSRYTSLQIASMCGCTDAVKLLLQVSADPNIQTHSVDTSNNLSHLPSNMLLQPQIKTILLLIDFQIMSGLTALMFASVNGHSEIVQLLLNAKAKPDLQIENGETALYLAVGRGYPDIVQLLLDYRADPNISNRHGYSPIHLAAYCLNITTATARGDITSIEVVNTLTALNMVGKYEHHIKTMKLLIAQPNIKLNETNYDGYTILMQASIVGSVQIIELLLQAGADPNMSVKPPLDKHILPISKTLFSNESHLAGNEMIGWTALMLACDCGHLEVVQLLLKGKANPDLREAEGITALIIAAKQGFSDIVQQLLEYGADPNIGDENGCTAIHYITMLDDTETSQSSEKMMSDKLEMLELLIIRGINVNIKDRNGKTALMTASFFGFTEAVKLLLQAGADPNIEDHIPVKKLFITSGLPNTHTIGFTALTYASKQNNSEVTELLLKAKADPNQENAFALMTAAQQRYPDIVQQILKYGADPNSISNIDGSTGLIIAAQQRHPDIVQHLLEYGADPNIGDNIGCTAMHYMMMLDDTETPHLSEKMMSDKLEILQLLIVRGIDVNIKDGYGVTALMKASFWGFTEAVKLLLQTGADANLISDIDGYTAIHCDMMLYDPETPQLQPSEKIMSDKLEILQLLLVRGINVNIKNGNGVTALMTASVFGFTEAVKLLLQAGADPNIEQDRPVNEVFITSSLPKIHTIRFNALIYAVIRMNSEVVNLLLKAKANPNQENALALMFAAQYGYPDIVQQLLKYGADPNSISNIDGSTTLHCILESLEETPHNDDKDKEKTFIKLAIIQQLLETGANIINIQNQDRLTALIMATDKGLSEIVELLLQNGADPNVHGNKGRTALMYACSHGNSKVAEILLRFNANPQLVDNDGFTASIHALCSGNKGLAYELVNDKNVSQNELKCLLIMDLLEGNQTEAILRLDDITDLTTDKKELLISCVVGSLEDVVGKLHESGLHPDTPLVAGLTLLMIASSCGYIELVEYLVIIEADVNQRDIFWKYTPLFYAILGSKSNEIVELLLENGADINAVAGNQTPLDMTNSSPVENTMSSLLIKNGGQTFSELTSVKKSEIVDMQPPIKKKSAIFAYVSNQVKSLIQDTVVKREQTEYTIHTHITHTKSILYN